MRFIAFFCSLLSFSVSLAQIGTGQWRLHVPSRSAIDVIHNNEKVYAVFSDGLLEYDPGSGEKSLWDKVNSLSDISLSCAAFHPASDAIYIGYENGNIDKIKDNRVYNIPAIKLAEFQGSKRVNKIVTHGNYVYCATDFAIVIVNPAKNEIRDTYYPTLTNEPILDIAFKNDSIFALTANEIFKGSLNNTALADPQQWVSDNRFPVQNTLSYGDIEFLDDYFYISLINENYGADTVFQVATNGDWQRVSSTDFSHEIRGLSVVDGRITEALEGSAIVYDPDFSYYLVINSYSFGGPVDVNKMIHFQGLYFLADNTQGLVRFAGGGSIKLDFTGPPKSSFYSLSGYRDQIVVFGGSISGSNATYNPAGFYRFQDESWSLYDWDNSAGWTPARIWDYNCGSVNPVNPDETAVGSYSHIPVTIYNTAQMTQDTFNVDNTILENTSLGNGMSVVTDVQYDESGNLWIVNGLCNNPLKVYTSSGEWYAPVMPSTVKSKMTGELAVDYNGNKWYSVQGVGLVGFKDNGTIGNLSDDKYKVLNSGETSGALPATNVTAIAVDFDNEIWIGTESGFAILYNSDGIFDASPGEYNAQRIKLEFEGNTEYLLGNSYISDIEVDGGNRKWIGTSGNGIFLLSADGLDIIREFNTDNSPLLSNNIVDMQFDQTSGELYIITDVGLISYRTDASYEDPEYSDVQVFPNPVRPGFDGPVTIQGIRYNSDVHITDAAGNVVYKTTSNGGTATWNCRTLDGERAATGVYIIWTAANEGKGKKVGKVVVIN